MVLAPVVRGRKGEYGKVARGAARRGLPAREGRRRAAACSTRRSCSTRSSSTTSRSSSTAWSCAATCASAWPTRSRRRSRWPTAWSRSRPCRAKVGRPGSVTLYSEKFACPDHGPVIPELEPRIFSFNSPHGACERCTGLGSQMEIDPELVVPDPSLSHRRGRDRAVGGQRVAVLRADHRRRSPSTTASTSRRPGTSCGASAQDLFLHGTDGERVAGHLPQPLRAPALVLHALRGHHPQPRAPLPRDGLRAVAREDRGVHVARAVPGVQGRAPAARVAGGARRRDRDPRVLGAVGPPRAGLAGRGRSSPRPSATSRG